jgi:hypothetical protein
MTTRNERTQFRKGADSMSDTWIATSERMPEPFIKVPILIRDAGPLGSLMKDMAYYNSRKDNWICIDRVAVDASRVEFWLPLPPLPSEEGVTNGIL